MQSQQQSYGDDKRWIYSESKVAKWGSKRNRLREEVVIWENAKLIKGWQFQCFSRAKFLSLHQLKAIHDSRRIRQHLRMIPITASATFFSSVTCKLKYDSSMNRFIECIYQFNPKLIFIYSLVWKFNWSNLLNFSFFVFRFSFILLNLTLLNYNLHLSFQFIKADLIELSGYKIINDAWRNSD